GGVLGGLAGMGINAGHLLAASVISAPGALLLAKVMQPELEEPKTRGNVKIDVEDPSANVLEAVASGTVGGLQLALNVGAMLIVFLALIAVVNAVLAVVGDTFWQLIGRFELAQVPADPGPWSLEGILGFLFRPIAWLIGIEWSECALAGELMGLKMATNEFVAYDRTEEQVGRLIGADMLVYQRISDLVQSAAEGNPAIRQFDCSVFDGKYVTGDIDRTYLERLSFNRSDEMKQRRDADLSHDQTTIDLHNHA
ncbi:nucleoside transporter C-terminal domain-containing protein, partial [Limnoraphis robusta CCNP1324]|uniref:nucleoside transporter C-terminal domain-containing protein n=1 Tax=Limnoraphis robusta TaxID=1118279 RepID=UPI002B20C053